MHSQPFVNPRPQPTEAAGPIIVLGIGNVLWADEGFGVRCVELLQQRYAFAPHVQLVDGGTQGLYLISYVQSAERLLILDAIDYGLAPGTLRIIEDEEVPKFLGAKKMSLHQTGFQEVLQLAELTGHYPQRVVLVGCQPEELDDYGGSLRPAVKAALEPAIERACEVLCEWGAEPVPRSGTLAPDEAVTTEHLAITRYEAERPTEQDACRTGDARFFSHHG
ncbi:MULTISPECIES: HyaD/HybD family hydrogenase maturation endopeptidase [Paraburkholderia]|uniref:HyaD/HybD family hydrogenase maturation endopeptidase n=2 Tax=Paraburkholderia TaxID=1822464 RepID=A0A248VYA9_9BURK|nr:MULTISPECIES: HyaD/HybD family hydrogenase maturation endopeptidase [Paraburkholderia]ASW04021.1 HyaD/HybD family hydrogenase maturation endopeptidase [Paraburkholderia aromaticivorans]CAB3738622.1 Hydrogenase 1 maturation protease [Paraburkholderia phenoliruptrix]